MENVLLLEGLLDRGLQFLSKAGCKVSPYWFNPVLELNNITRRISMNIPLRRGKYIARLSYDFFEGEITDIVLEANVLWRSIKISNTEPRYVDLELINGEYYYRWKINFWPFVDPNIPVVVTAEGEQYNILLVSADNNMQV